MTTRFSDSHPRLFSIRAIGSFRSVVVLLLMFATSSCGRTLTTAEIQYANTLYASQMDVDRITIHSRNPLYAFRSTRDPRPAKTCRERIHPPETAAVETRVAATTIGNRIFFARRFYLDEFLGQYPKVLPLADAMLLAHELTHVWQWQNRARTGYAPWKASGEHAQTDDPYLFALHSSARFSDFGYEQQAALVEEFVCCRALAPDAPRTARLYALLRPEFAGLARRSLVPNSNIVRPNPNFPEGPPCN
ncbi:hypothetical protein [Palleronia caenipelagi]|uniref:DUF4157 domain-containing protein n=1 Tax=Palleronia caenipelagi TaxID=2489174 RepID=A0A547Q6Z4_9RHOB|nr:hypothetical protein [Palleronia caenipelagi]TRD22157.1 hypothetical protein FEV53_05385 [Palleronia caenipelagi]